ADRVAADGGPDGARRRGPADLRRDAAIGGARTVRYREQRSPHRLLERRAARKVQRHGELPAPAPEVLVEFGRERSEQAIVAVHDPAIDDRIVALVDEPQS